MAHHRAYPPRFGGPAFFSEGDDRILHVRVQFDVVGIGVVPVMFLHPPTAVDAHQGAHHQAPYLVVDAPAKHLSVAEVVSQEAELPE